MAAAGCKKESPPTAEPGAPADPGVPEKTAKKTTDSETQPVEKNSDVALEWTLTRDGEHLRLEYQLTNETGGDIFVADKLLVYNSTIKLAPERVIVTAGSAPDVVRLVRGLVEPDTEEMNHPPGAERLAPGATHRGSATIPLPLRGWHNYSTPPEIPDNPRSVELEIAYLVGDAIQWGVVKTNDGVDVTVPQMPSYLRFARTVRTAPRPIP